MQVISSKDNISFGILCSEQCRCNIEVESVNVLYWNAFDFSFVFQAKKKITRINLFHTGPVNETEGSTKRSHEIKHSCVQFHSCKEKLTESICSTLSHQMRRRGQQNVCMRLYTGVSSFILVRPYPIVCSMNTYICKNYRMTSPHLRFRTMDYATQLTHITVSFKVSFRQYLQRGDFLWVFF